MEAVKISSGNWNYFKDDGTYLLDEHVLSCWDFREGFGIVYYYDNTYNFVNSEGKKLLKTNVDDCFEFCEGFACVKINNYIDKESNFYNIKKVSFYIDKECNFYNENKISFKELYNLYPNKRSELVEIIEKYTYFDVKEYFV